MRWLALVCLATGCPSTGKPTVDTGAPTDTSAPKDTAEPKDTATPSKGDAANGAEVYATYCVACHGPEGRGGSGMAMDFRSTPKTFAKSDAALVKSIRQGVTGPTGEMPSWGSVVDEATALDLVAYVRTTSISGTASE